MKLFLGHGQSSWFSASFSNSPLNVRGLIGTDLSSIVPRNSFFEYSRLKIHFLSFQWLTNQSNTHVAEAARAVAGVGLGAPDFHEKSPKVNVCFRQKNTVKAWPKNHSSRFVTALFGA